MANHLGLVSRTAAEEKELQEFLTSELAKFKDVRGPTIWITHVIRTKTDIPIKQRYRPWNPAMQRIIDEEVSAMETDGIIEPSNSAWSSPIVIVRKKDGRHRFCIDFRKINVVTERDAYPLPHIGATLDELRGAKYLSTLDLKNGYWQAPLAESRPIIAFTVPSRTRHAVQSHAFWAAFSPGYLPTTVGYHTRAGIGTKHLRIFGIIVVSANFHDHLNHLQEIFRRLREARLQLNPEKYHFRNELKYLGHVIDRRGIRTDPEKTKAIAQWPTTTTVKQIRQFIGMASWYRRFIRDFSTTAAPLTSMTRKNAKWKWGPEKNAAFHKLKQALISTPILACSDFEQPFTVQTDASTSGLGVIPKLQGKRTGYSLCEPHVKWRREELQRNRTRMFGRRMGNSPPPRLSGGIYVYGSYRPSSSPVATKNEFTGRVIRWALELQQYTFNVQYRGGSLNRVADALSRRPHVNTIRPSQCTWYTRQIRKVIERSEDYPEYEIRDDFSATFYTPLISRKHRLRSSGKSAYLENKDFQRSTACTTIRPPDI